MPASFHVPDGNIDTLHFAGSAPVSPASSPCPISVFSRANRGKACLAIALFCASLLWPSFALARLAISASLNNRDAGGKVAEPILLMNPNANLGSGIKIPLFRLTVTATDIGSAQDADRRWYYSRLQFTRLGAAAPAVSVCADSTLVFPAQGGTLNSENFRPFNTLPADTREALELLPPGDYQLSIQAFNSRANCENAQYSSLAISDPVKVNGILTVMPLQEIASATVDGNATANLQPGDKLDLHFTVRNNRTSEASAGVGRVEWLIAAAPPRASAINHATGMACARPDPTTGGFSGTYSSKLLKSRNDAVAVPNNIGFGTYNLYLRVHDDNSSSACSANGAITPVFELKNAIVVEPGVQSINMTPVQLPPQLPVAVGMNGATVMWEVKFSQPVTGVSAKVFRLVATGIGAPPAIVSVTGSGSIYHVTANVPAGSIMPDKQAGLRLDFVDDDSVRTVAGQRPMGGPGSGNGNFSGETHALTGTICGAANAIWCDDFERTVQGAKRADMVGNGWTVTSAENDCTSYKPGNSAQPDSGGCAGIDSDIKPYHKYAVDARANRGRTMFNRWRQHAVTSRQIDLSGLPAGAVVEFSYWVRRGSDKFADAPSGNNAHMFAEYLDKNGKWQTLAYHRSGGGGGLEGEILRPMFQLPEAALWKGFQLRFTQNAGRGRADRSDAKRVNGHDYWFIDDVLLRRVDAPRYTGGFCDNFEAPTASLKQWSFNYEDAATGAKPGGFRVGEAGITGDIYPTNGSSEHSMFLRWSYVAAATMRIDTRGLNEPISYIAQRGMKNAPNKINGANVVTSCDQTTADPGNHLVSEYWGSDKKWHVLRDDDGVPSGHCGEDLSFVSPPLSQLPHAQHENFRLRFRQLSYGGFQDSATYNYDYWLVDDVCVGRKAANFPVADLELMKKREGPLRPDEITTYVLSVKNNGPDRLRGSLEIVDILPPELSFHTFRGKGWACREAGQEITCSWSGDLEKGDSAPDLRLYALLSKAAKDRLTNTAVLSSGAVNDPGRSNNTATDVSRLESAHFAFTKGPCKNGQAIEGVSSGNACSHYRFDGLAGELKTGIYITQMDGAGTFAMDTPSGTSVSFEFALRCVDPPEPPAQGAAYAAFGGNMLLPLSLCAKDSEPTPNWSTTAPISVTIMPGEATANGAFNFFYEDVGRLELFMRIAGENDKKNTSGEFVQKPAALALKNVSCADGTVNPGARTPGDARFCKAGQAFEMTVESRSVQGNATPNFGNESTGKAVFLEKTLLMPSNGDDPDLAVRSLSNFTKGTATITNQAWEEVGIISVTPRLGDKSAGNVVLSDDYLGAGDVPATGRRSVNIGRFYPDRFQTEIGSLGRMGCPPGLTCPPGGFFYAGQPFELKVRACPYGDKTCSVRLENYRDDFAALVKLSAWAVRGSTVKTDENPPNSAVNGGHLHPMPGQGLGAAEIPAGKFVDAYGEGGVFSGLFNYAHAIRSRPVEPVDIHIRAAENGRDGVSSLLAAMPANSPEAGIKVARGRIKLTSHFGAGKANLEIPLQVQFWHCDGINCVWVPSATDATRIGPNTPLVDMGKRAALSVSLHPSPGAAAMMSPPQVERLELSGGRGRIILKPGADTGSVGVSINLGAGAEDNACDHVMGYREGAASNIPWLRAWNGVCTQAQSGEADPAARASFGIYSGESHRAVHKREVY
ncbi:MAG: DUF11 domain-containing protein [Azoarcus sp.]|jgi:uncharacterized repeat protein (TIGR01451 family)|nr:DUF11 domain-containing protein [Azoarcus sp.]